MVLKKWWGRVGDVARPERSLGGAGDSTSAPAPSPWPGPSPYSSCPSTHPGQLQMDAYTLVGTSWKLIPNHKTSRAAADGRPHLGRDLLEAHPIPSHPIPGPSPFPTSLLEASLDLLIMVLPVQGIPLLSITLRDGAFWESVKKILLWLVFFHYF